LRPERATAALESFDDLYPQNSGQSALQRSLAQLSSATLFDMKETDLANYKNLDRRWADFDAVRRALGDIATDLFYRVTGFEPNGPSSPPNS
jgi:hypothetical protein